MLFLGCGENDKGDLVMGNKTSEELVKFLDELEKFLKNSNPNLGRKSIKRAEFINEILKRVHDFVDDPEAETPQDTQSRIRKRRTDAMSDRVIRMEPNEQIRKALGEKGAAIMTEKASMQADEELGNAHNMIEEE